MASNVYADETLDMMCEGLFDNIEDLLDFSSDDELLGIDGGDKNKDGDDMHICHATISFPTSEEEGSRVTDTSVENKVGEEINGVDDWITHFLDDSNFKLDFPATTTAIIEEKDEPLFESFSPVSVLEEPNNLSNEKVGLYSSSSSSSSSTRTSQSAGTVVSLAPVRPTVMPVPARARTKRARRPSPGHVTDLILPPSTDGPPAVPTILPETESFGESFPPPIKSKKKKTSNTNSEDITVRKCLHCGIQKTPQWRAGPMGPKTLCNACGVRYKSGRLFPEYRPAASPTFVPSIHSNSHKKVVEMRNKTVVASPSPDFTPATPAAKNCDLLAYIRRS